jgi:hypothetical protein
MLLETSRKVAPGLTSWLDLAMWNRVIGDIHHQAALLVGKAWKLPPGILVGREQEFDIGERHSLANVVKTANALAKQVGFTTGPIDVDQLSGIVQSGSSIVGIAPNVVEQIAQAVVEAGMQ